MQPSKAQFIMVAGIGGIVLLFFLIFTGVLPGLQKDNKAAKNAAQGELVMWGMYDDADVLKPVFAAFKARYPNTQISYKKFTDPTRYEAELLEALATRKGPDIFMIPNGSLERHKEKIAFAPEAVVSLLSLRRLFPRVVEEDFVLEGRVGALPLSIDTLALLYNRSALYEAGIALPPETWEDLEAMIPRLVKRDGAGDLTRAGVGLGGSADTIARAGDIVKLIAFQNAAAEGTSLGAAMGGSAGDRALRFYAKFGEVASPLSTWNEGMPYSLDALGAGRVAMIFGYFTDMKNISARNGLMEITAAKAPQKKDVAVPIALANYWGYTVSSQSRIPDIAWQFIVMLTGDKGIAEAYLKATGRPPALNSLIEASIQDPALHVFAEQALIARSARVADERKEKEGLENMIRNAIKK